MITSLDGHTIDLPEMSLAQSNMTVVRLIDKDDVETQNVAIDWNRWVIDRNAMPTYSTKWSNYMKVENLKVILNYGHNKLYSAFNFQMNLNRFQTEAALIRDAVLTLAKSFKGNRALIDNLNPPRLYCSYSNDKLNPTDYPIWENGRTIMKNIDEV